MAITINNAPSRQTIGQPKQGAPRYTSPLLQHLNAPAPQPPPQQFAPDDLAEELDFYQPENARQFTLTRAADRYGWGEDELGALDGLITRESGWNPTAQNPSSGAYGLFQFVPMHWKQGGYLPSGPEADIFEQIDGGLDYIADRYGSPSNALNFWLQRIPIEGNDVGNWY